MPIDALVRPFSQRAHHAAGHENMLWSSGPSWNSRPGGVVVRRAPWDIPPSILGLLLQARGRLGEASQNGRRQSWRASHAGRVAGGRDHAVGILSGRTPQGVFSRIMGNSHTVASRSGSPTTGLPEPTAPEPHLRRDPASSRPLPRDPPRPAGTAPGCGQAAVDDG